MNDESNNKGMSCLRGLKRFELGQDFNLWVFNFYNEMVEKNLHHYFPYNSESQLRADRINERKSKTISAATESESITAKETKRIKMF